ncbi:MAG TPA: hypothetical protein VM142_15790 [Acidimicrobiales bacterium]|nr:hypothetical protein [Acidimicrobiales bacterium]
MEPTENDPITRRLHSLGNQPVDPEVVASHRNLMASVPVAPSRSRLRPLMVGSLLAGSLLGGMGLAAAAPSVILPPSASNAAQEALNKVTLGVVADPDDADDENGNGKPDHAAKNAAKAAKKDARTAGQPAGTHGVTRSTANCRPGFAGNHGQHVSGTAKDPDTDVNERQVAAKQDCGKPVHAPNAPQTENSNKPASPGKSDEEHGKSEAGVENGQSSADHPDDHANERAAENVGKNADGVAGNSAGHRHGGVPTP